MADRRRRRRRQRRPSRARQSLRPDRPRRSAAGLLRHRRTDDRRGPGDGPDRPRPRPRRRHRLRHRLPERIRVRRKHQRLASPPAAGGAEAEVLVDDIAYFEEPFFQDGPIGAAIEEVTDDGVAYFSAAGNDNLIDAEGNDIASWETPSYRDTACPPELETLGPFEECLDFDPERRRRRPDLRDHGRTGGSAQRRPAVGRTALRRRIRPRRLPARRRRQTADRRRRQRRNLRRQRRQQHRRRLRKHRAAGRVLRLGKHLRRRRRSPAGRQPLLRDLQSGRQPGGETAGQGRVPGERRRGLGDRVPQIGRRRHGRARRSTATPGPRPRSASARRRSTTAPWSSPTPRTAPSPTTSGRPNTALAAAPLAQPLEITKPDLVATDCGLTTFFVPTSTPGINRFCGTSAAAPHAAAVAALMRDANPAMTVAQIRTALAASARPIGNLGPDVVGAGLVDARRRGGPRRAPARSRNHRIPGRTQPQSQPARRLRRQPAGDLLLLGRRSGVDPVLLAVRAARRRWKTANTPSPSAGPTSPAARDRANPKTSRSTPPPPDVAHPQAPEEGDPDQEEQR